MADFTLPPVRAIGNPGHVGDHNNIVAALMQALTVNVLNGAYAGGADPTGATASDAAFAAAFTALAGGSGTIRIPTGTYKLTSGWTLNLADSQQVIILCDAGVTFTYTGSVDCIRMLSAATSLFARGSGILGNPTIDGTSASAGAAGLHFGDISEGRVAVTVQNFNVGPGSIGVHFDNTIAWTERLQASISLNNNSNNVIFDESGATTSTGSYARLEADIVISNGAVTNNGVVVTSGAFIYDGKVSIRGNFTSGASGTPGPVLTVSGVGPAGHPNAGTASSILACQLDIGVEAPTGVVLPQTIKYGTAANSITECYGSLNFTGGGGFLASNLSASDTFTFQGPINGDSTLVATVYSGIWSLGAIITGGTISIAQAGTVLVNPAGAVTGIIIQPGTQDGQQAIVINNSANLVTFAAAATSNVAGGAGATVPATTNRVFVWRAATARWYGGL